MNFPDVIRSSGLVLAFCLVVPFDRQIWIQADIIAALGFGAAFCVFPEQLMRFMVEGDLDTLHHQLAQLFGVTLMCSSFIWYFTRETRDGTIPITLMISRVFTCGMLLLSLAYTQWAVPVRLNAPTWNEQHIMFGMLGVSLWLLGNLIHLLRSGDFSTYPQHTTRLNSHLRMDAWLMMLASLATFAFPEYTLQNLFPSGQKVDAIHFHLVRITGVQAMGAAIISLQAPGFLHEHEKRYIFFGRLLTYVALFAALSVQHVYIGKFVWKRLGRLALFVAPIVVNAVLGSLSNSTPIVWPWRECSVCEASNSKDKADGLSARESSKSKGKTE